MLTPVLHLIAKLWMSDGDVQYQDVHTCNLRSINRLHVCCVIEAKKAE